MTKTPNGFAPRLPQQGWFLDREWVAAIHGIELDSGFQSKKFATKLETFRANISKHNIPYLKWGANYIIHTFDFYGVRDVENYQPAPNGIAPRLPQHGMFLDEEWAKAFDEEVSTFRKKVREMEVTHQENGLKYIVTADEFYSRLVDISNDGSC